MFDHREKEVRKDDHNNRDLCVVRERARYRERERGVTVVLVVGGGIARTNPQVLSGH